MRLPPRHRSECLAKVAELGVRIRAQRLYHQLDLLRPVRLEARRELAVGKGKALGREVASSESSYSIAVVLIEQGSETKHMNLSFAKDIQPLFRESDVEAMKNFGLDLSSYEEVKEKAPAIYGTLENGSMPCDEPWPKDQVGLFKRWMDEGMAA